MAAGFPITLELCAPERDRIEVEVSQVVLPGEEGFFTVQAGHTPLLSTLAPGVLKVKSQAGEEFFAVSGGFAEVKKNRITVLADTFERGDRIDESRAAQARDRAENRLKKPDEDTDVQRAELALRRSIARISAKERKMF